MTEDEIRWEERKKCSEEIKAYAYQFLAKWEYIIGADRAKAGAMDILSAARSLLPIGGAPSNGTE